MRKKSGQEEVGALALDGLSDQDVIRAALQASIQHHAGRDLRGRPFSGSLKDIVENGQKVAVLCESALERSLLREEDVRAA